MLKFSLIYLGMKKTANDEMIDKIKVNEENETNISEFIGEGEFSMFLFAIPTGAAMV